MMDENKRAFVSALETALILYSREKIAKMEYDPHNEAWSGLETVEIRFAGGHRKVIDVTGDSCIAIMHDIWEALA
jgi:hypothetical protein